MNQIWIYSLVSVFIVSLVSFIGIITLVIKTENLKKILIYFISFSAGALFGGAFLHLLPEVSKEVGGLTINISLLTLLGILIFFIVEKVVCWNHCHMPITKTHVHSYAIMNLVGDFVHNILDGMIIAGSYLLNIQLGITTTLAVILHEIPQEIGDFGVLVHGGFKKYKALVLNFLTGLSAIIGVIVTLILKGTIENISILLIPIAAGGFIYIAGSDLIPELHKKTNIGSTIIQIITFLAGISIMTLLLFLEI